MRKRPKETRLERTVRELPKSNDQLPCTLRVAKDCTGRAGMVCHVRRGHAGMGTKVAMTASYLGCYWCHLVEGAHKASDEDILRAVVESQAYYWSVIDK